MNEEVEKDNKVSYSVSIRPSTIEALKRIAKQEERSISWIVEKIITDGLGDYE